MISLASASPLESDTSNGSVDSFTVSETSTMSHEPAISLDELDIDALLAAAKSTLQHKDRVAKSPSRPKPSAAENSTLDEIKHTISSIPKLSDTESILEAKKAPSKTTPSSLASQFKQPKSKSDSLVFRSITDPVLAKREAKENREKSAGDKWFNMPKAELTPELKRDLQLIQMRNVLDPKRHYKKNTFGYNADGETAFPKYVQQGTIVQDSSEFFSARLTRKQRKTTFAEELLSDNKTRQYFKRKYDEIAEQKNKFRKDRRRKY